MLKASVGVITMARIQRKAHDSSVVLYNHQKEAMCALNKADIGGEFSGIIVLPTGGGKRCVEILYE